MYSNYPPSSAYGMQPAFGSASFGAATTSAEREHANDFGKEIRDVVIAGKPLTDLAQSTAVARNSGPLPKASNGRTQLPHKPTWASQYLWYDVSEYVLRDKNDHMTKAKGACAADFDGVPAKRCRDMLRAIRRKRSYLKKNPWETGHIIGTAPSPTGKAKLKKPVPVTMQDIRDFKLVTGKTNVHASHVRPKKKQTRVWEVIQWQASELRQVFSLPRDATFIPSYKGVPGTTILAGLTGSGEMPPTTDGSSEEQEALYNMPAAPLWPMALMLLGGVGFLGTAVWYLLRR